MKQIYFSALAAIFFISMGTSAYAAGEIVCTGAHPNVCTQNFSPVPLRYGVKYRFHDTWNNLSATPQYMNTKAISYENPQFLGVGIKHPSGLDFDWTQTLRNAGFAVAPYSSMEILTTASDDWQVIAKPSNGRKNPLLGQYDFAVKYTTTYDTSNNYPNASDDITHIENQPYYVTWCGDGVKDGPNDDADINTPGIQAEECDGSDGVPAGKVCSSLCKLEDIPTPACTSLIANPTSGTGAFGVNLTCNGANLAIGATYTISCGNGNNALMNADGKSGVCSYVNNSPKTNFAYNAVCTISSSGVNYTSSSCNQSIIGAVDPNNRFDLSLKKYVDTVAPANDADTEATAINKTSNTNFSYQVVVRNEGAGAVSGVTTVNDTLPANILFASASGAVSGAGWSCNQSTNSFSCTRSDSTASGTAFAPISVSVRTSATVASGTIIRNDATVSNLNETDVISNTNPAHIRITGDLGGAGILSIKKYAGTIATGDSQTESSAVGVSRGTEFNYLYRVTVSSGSVSGAIVRDVLPEYVEFVRFGSTPAGWSTGATTTTHSGHTHSVVMHQTDNLLASGSSYDFTIVARLRADAVGQYHQNIAYVCAKKILSGGSLIDNPACTTTVPPLPPDTGCPARAADTQSDPACIRANDGFDLVIRKYINDNDAESAIDLANGATFNYRIVVTNNGPAAVNGSTSISDTFPAGVERTSAAITTNGWSCSGSGTLSCTIIQGVAAGANFPEIVIPMRVTAGANTTVTNTACVTNDNEIDGRRINQDTNNCNTAVLHVPGGDGDPLRCISVAKITNTQFACQGNAQARSFGVDTDGDYDIDYVGDFSTGNPASFPVNHSLPGVYDVKCIVSNWSTFPMSVGDNYTREISKYPFSTDTNDNDCRVKATTVCANPNGCGGVGPFCGDGVVQVDRGEECDAGNGYIPGCTSACKMDDTIRTTPGTQDLPFFTISPVEAPSREYNLGPNKKLQYIQGRTNPQVFESYRLIVGENTPIFRVGDKIHFRSPGYVFVPDNTRGSLSIGITNNSGSPLRGSLETNLPSVCIGNGDDYTTTPDSSNSFARLKPDRSGYEWVSCPPLKDVFTIDASNLNTIKAKSGIQFNGMDYKDTNTPLNTDPTASSIYNFYGYTKRGLTEYLQYPLSVRVTRPIIANNAGGAGYFANPNQTVDIDTVAKDFLEQLKAANFNTGKAQNPSGSPTSFNLSSIVPSSISATSGLISPIDGSTVSVYRTNSTNSRTIGQSSVNTNITTKKTFVIDGTLFINGSIISDKSVAFIAKEIVIGSGVTSIDGVYIAEKISGMPSEKQLIVNGSLYGDASELIKARTYARGSSASSGIVTGILVNYSSRVLSDPPPLVSDFLKQYNLTKVTSVQ